MTAFDTQVDQDAVELQRLAAQVRELQQARNLTTAEMIRRYPGLGSDKTFGSILAGRLEELDVARWLISYRSVWAVLESLSSREEAEEEVYDDLAAVTLLRKAMTDLLAERSIARLILVEGDSGSGKSSAAHALQRRYGQRVVIVEASDCWGTSAMAMLGVILQALGVRETALTAAGRLLQVQQRLQDRRTCLIIDEAHHLRPVALNTLKTLVNTTPGEFVLLTLPTLWRRLELGAYEEVRQLTGNRLSERIVLGGVREADVRRLLERRAGVKDTQAVRAVREAAAVRGRGNLQFVRQVALRLRDMQITGEPTLEQVCAAIQQQLQRRAEHAQR